MVGLYERVFNKKIKEVIVKFGNRGKTKKKEGGTKQEGVRQE